MNGKAGTEDRLSGAEQAIRANLSYTLRSASSAAEKRLAHLKEQADWITRRILRETGQSDVMQAILLSDDAAAIYRENATDGEAPALFGAVNAAEERPVLRAISRLDRFYRCACIAASGARHPLSDYFGWFFGACGEMPTGADRKISFLRSVQASRAFEKIAKYLGGVSAVYESNFQSACESVYNGNVTCALLPIYNTSDGRLNGFYRLLDQYELTIALTCVVEADDGENATEFALAYRDRLLIPTEGKPVFECQITLDDPTMLADLLDAADYFGVGAESVDAIPQMFSGRENTFALVFSFTEQTDTDGFFCYLMLEYPQAAARGIYYRAGEGTL